VVQPNKLLIIVGLCVVLCSTITACSDKAQQARRFARSACNLEGLVQAGSLGQPDISYFVISQRADNQYRYFKQAEGPAAQAASRDFRWTDLLTSIVTLLQALATIKDEVTPPDSQSAQTYNDNYAKYKSACAIANAN
jgi:hypothetical protein